MEPALPPPQPQEPAGAATVAWCLGIRRTGSRRLEAEERSHLTGLARGFLGSLWKPGLFMVLSLVFFLLGAAFLDLHDRRGGATPAALGAGSLALGAVLLGGGLLRSITVLRRWYYLRRDLARGEVECFGERRDAPSEALKARYAEVLPFSQALLSVDGQAVRDWLAVPVAEAAAPPAAPVRLAVSRALAEKLDSSLVVERRRLSAPELEELARHIVRLRAPSGTLLLLIALTVLGLVMAIAGGETFQGLELGDLVYVVLVTAALGLNGWVYLHGRRLAGRLARDRKDEWVVIVATDREPSVEMLPASGVVWTENGQPGDWRLNPTRRRPR